MFGRNVGPQGESAARKIDLFALLKVTERNEHVIVRIQLQHPAWRHSPIPSVSLIARCFTRLSCVSYAGLSSISYHKIFQFICRMLLTPATGLRLARRRAPSPSSSWVSSKGECRSSGAFERRQIRTMKLIRSGEAGKEKPGVLLNDGTRVNVSQFVSDYDERFFADDGLDALRQWL